MSGLYRTHMQRTWSADIFAWDAEPPKAYTESDFELHKADCLKVYSSISDGEIDLLLTDPPYGMTRNGWDTKDFRDMLSETWSHWNRIVKPNGAVVVMAASPFDKIMATSNLSSFKYEWIWNKNKATGHLNSKRLPMKAHENLLVFYRHAPIYNPQRTLGHAPSNAVNPEIIPEPDQLRNYGHHNCLGNPGGNTDRLPRTIINIPVINNDNDDKWHPTQKPMKLMELMIRTYTNEGQKVLDPFMGSGSTGLAALKCGRKFVGIEKNADYFKQTQAVFHQSKLGGNHHECNGEIGTY